MTAGSGILHIEKPPEWLVCSGGLFHGVQLWVNLPASQKREDPRYQDIRAGQVGLLTTPDAGALVRLIAGDVAGHEGPGSTHTPMTMVHATVAPSAQLELPWNPKYNALVYVLAGNGTIGPQHRPIHTGQTAVLGSGDVVSVAAAAKQDARHPALELLVLGGRAIGEPVAWAGLFVMNTRKRSPRLSTTSSGAGSGRSQPCTGPRPTRAGRVRLELARLRGWVPGRTGRAPTRERLSP